MMDNLRAASSHVALKILLAVIILSFVLTSVSSYLVGGNSDYAAKVNGQEISRIQFERAYENEREHQHQQQRLGEQFSELASNENYMRYVRQQVLSQLIRQVLQEQYTQKLNLGIRDDQIEQTIFSQPYFQTRGVFDKDKYLALLSNSGISADSYAAMLRIGLATQQLETGIVGSDFMLKGETDALAALIAQQRVVRQAVIDVNAMAAKQTVSEEDINNYYQQNKNSFMSPEQFRVSYIKLDAASMQQPAAESDIQTWYEQHKADYTQPQRNRYSIIQTKTDAEAQAILDLLKKGQDFAALAKSKSIDVISGRKGGDTGWLDVNAIPDELKNTGLQKIGQLSGVIPSSVGSLIVRLDDVQPERLKPLAEVHKLVADKVSQEKAIDAYYKLQAKVSEAAGNDNQSLDGAAQVAGVKVVETDWFSHDKIPAALNFKPVIQAIFNGSLSGGDNSAGSNSDIITVDGNQAFVLRISAHKPSAVLTQDEIRPQIISSLQQASAEQQARAEAAKFVAELNEGKDASLKAAGLSFAAARTLTRGDGDALNDAVFSLPLPSADKTVYGSGKDMQGNIVILALDSVKPGQMTAEQQRMLAMSGSQIIFDTLISNLYKNAKIKYGSAAQLQ